MKTVYILAITFLVAVCHVQCEELHDEVRQIASMTARAIVQQLGELREENAASTYAPWHGQMKKRNFLLDGRLG
ncbi:hypothetical protein Ciccas_014370 [Cichlidogyrus casuarinus]|uniref:Uncharacterized protein n=1 Tax=Cichlidogyrus casuarinus TaxID=1844966 RepID=A0ABD2PIG5_9PLAT